MDVNVANLPADLRAETTLRQLLNPYLDKVENATSAKEVISAIGRHLPSGLAHQTELRLRLYMLQDTKLSAIKSQAESITIDIIAKSISTLGYYTRENILDWYEASAVAIRYFTKPSDEIITITTGLHMAKIKSREVKLSNDQFIGIAYGLHALQSTQVQLQSSLLTTPIDVATIIKTSTTYFQPIELAVNKLKRPYTVEIINRDDTSTNVHFSNPEFMQGLLSVAVWHDLPNNGNNILWKNLTQFTREGIIPLEF